MRRQAAYSTCNAFGDRLLQLYQGASLIFKKGSAWKPDHGAVAHEFSLWAMQAMHVPALQLESHQDLCTLAWLSCALGSLKRPLRLADHL